MMHNKIVAMGAAVMLLLSGAVCAQDTVPASSPTVFSASDFASNLAQAADDDAQMAVIIDAITAANGDTAIITAILEQAVAAGMSEDMLLAIAISLNVNQDIIAAVLPNTQTAANSQPQNPSVINLPGASANRAVILPTTPGAGGGAGGGGATISRN